MLFLLSLHKVTNREQVEEEEEEKETHTEQTESSSSDSENEGTKDLKEDDDDERLFKEKTIDSMRSERIKEEPVQPGTFSGFSFKKRTNFKKPQIRKRINENDY